MNRNPTLLFILSWTLLYAEPKYPVDVSYLVSDFKYSREHGLKICEVQQGALSAVTGDLYIAGEEGTIAPLIADFFALFPMKKWAAGFFIPTQKILKSERVGDSADNEYAVKRSHIFKMRNAASCDPFSIASYAGIVYAALILFEILTPIVRPTRGSLLSMQRPFPFGGINTK